MGGEEVSHAPHVAAGAPPRRTPERQQSLHHRSKGHVGREPHVCGRGVRGVGYISAEVRSVAGDDGERVRSLLGRDGWQAGLDGRVFILITTRDINIAFQISWKFSRTFATITWGISQEDRLCQ